MHKFYGTPHDSMEGFREGISKARESDGHKRDGALEATLMSLLGLRDRIADTGFEDSDQLRKFREESSAAILDFPEFRREVMAYPNITFYMVEDAEEGDWYRLCLRRSVIQVVLDDYANTPVADLVNLEDVKELDEELRREGLRQRPVSKEHIPNGLDEKHWWWRYQHTSPDYDEHLVRPERSTWDWG